MASLDETERGFGLCASCGHARRIRSGRGSTFLRCGLSDTDPAYRRYPPIPVTLCAGYDPSASQERPEASETGKSFK
ncbi:MAG: hypothetical protein FJ144_18035 [Deltaproteobacteria bacterium]|nr:hypothetical protein [Deltaproteobacteria bacterium]